MSVRIIENFWSTYAQNKDVVTRCFMHHFNRHPDAEGIDGSFNNLLVKMHEMGVFERFNLRRLAEAAGKTELLSKEVITEADLKEAGINVQKKWEQFLYKWIEKIVNDQYNANGKRSRKFINNYNSMDYGVSVEERTPWIETEEEARAYEDKLAKDSGDRRGRIFPPTFENRYVAGEENFDNQFEAQSASDLKNKIMSRLTGKNDHAVFTLMLQDYSDKEIGEKLEVSQQYVSTITRKIRGTAKKLCAE